ncbi:MAG: DUF2845 domain-containing protein [Desulfobacterales bacterium]|nr:MAG: DUF2845 domain-containing protein [Desulfobacterales bacterium]
MKTIGIAIFLLVIAAGLTPDRIHAASLRCGVRIIAEGDYKDRVLAECGAPNHVEIWEEERVYRFQHHPRYYGIYDNYDFGPTITEPGKPFRVKKLVVVEVWTYNHGPTRFVDHLRLENGIVTDITSGDYGY